MEDAKNFFSDEDIAQIRKAIRSAEMQTSGEMRVHIENSTNGEDVLDRAAEVFSELNMNQTEERNGVLFYLAMQDRQFAILGDANINHQVKPGFWDDIKDVMRLHFKEGAFVDGLSKGVTMAGEQLCAHFPYQRDDENELPNEISFG